MSDFYAKTIAKKPKPKSESKCPNKLQPADLRLFLVLLGLEPVAVLGEDDGSLLRLALVNSLPNNAL